MLCLVRACLLAHGWCLLAVSSHGGKGPAALWSIFHKDANSTHLRPTPTIACRTGAQFQYISALVQQGAESPSVLTPNPEIQL
jgi:hypothetical protein